MMGDETRGLLPEAHSIRWQAERLRSLSRHRLGRRQATREVLFGVQN
jgi:hypothetical protein